MANRLPVDESGEELVICRRNVAQSCEKYCIQQNHFQLPVGRNCGSGPLHKYQHGRSYICQQDDGCCQASSQHTALPKLQTVPQASGRRPSFWLILFMTFVLLPPPLAVPLVNGNWLYLAVSQPFTFPPSHSQIPQSKLNEHYGQQCAALTYLDEHQRKICASHPLSMVSIGHGVREAIGECKWQFRFERWNCTTLPTANDSATDLFGSTLAAANKEAAFVEAITSAGMVIAVVSACTAGNLTDCSCDMSKQGLSARDPNEKWHWGGCSDNVRYGLLFGRDFLDRSLKKKFMQKREVRLLTTVHNQEVGRKAVAELVRRQCRCHGVSGSCEFKTCWQSAPRLTDVGQHLKMLYDRAAVQVARQARRRLRRKNKFERRVRIRTTELAYINRSPNYCVRDGALGILGTHGRLCNRTYSGAESCDVLCCGRGYDTRLTVRHERCHCKFVWCCYVTCKTCSWQADVHTCK